MNRLSKVFVMVAFILLCGIDKSHAGFGLKAGGGIGLGSMGNESGSIQSRTMNYASLYALPVYSFLGFYMGPIFEYRMVGQTTAEASAGNTNLRGAGYTFGLAAGFDFLVFHGQIGYDFNGQYKLANTTAAGQESIYTSPAGFRVSVGYTFMPFFSIDLNYVDHKYAKNSLAGTEVDIAGDKLKDTRYGLSVTFHF